jgi:hypothetical protein
VADYELDSWCCPDDETPMTNTLLDTTPEACSGTVSLGCASHDVQVLEDCSTDPRTDAARKCDNAGCHYSINYDSPKGGCTVTCTD